MDYHGLSWTIMNYHGLSWTINDNNGLLMTIMDYHGLSWTIYQLGYLRMDGLTNGHWYLLSRYCD